MKLGRNCEISTIEETVPELVETGPEVFFADGIYLGVPTIHRGTVSCGMTTFGKHTFLGNHVVVPAGPKVLDDILVGVCTVVRDDQLCRRTSWFGHPAYTPSGPAGLALLSRSPLQSAFVFERGGRWVMHWGPRRAFARSAKRDGDIAAITAWYTAYQEQLVRRDPHQWVWWHKRWRTQKTDENQSHA
jgi:predicted LPLAT superfamily acyltransferase